MPIPITNAELDYYKRKGASHIRMPLNFTVLYPTKFGPLDPTYLTTIKSILSYAQSINLDVKIDPHSFGGWGAYRVGSPDFPPEAFADFWGKVAVACIGYTNVRFDLMNEWAGPGPSNIFPQDYLQNSSIAAIKAIRGVGFTNWIYAEGNAYTGTWNWVNSNPGFENVIFADPLGKTKVSAHQYMDHDSSGGNFDWNTEIAITDPLVLGPTSLDVGVQRATVWVNWCKQFGFAMHLGEFGIPNGDTRWIEAGRRTLAYLQANNVEVDIWAAGPAWGNYPMSLEGYAGRQAKQWPMLQDYSGSTDQPNVYFMDGPTRGTQGVGTSAYTFEYRGRTSSPIMLTPNDGGLGGVFTPSTVILAAGDNPTGSATYVPAITGTINVGVTNNQGMTDPPSIGLGTLDDAFLHLTTGQYPLVATALRRIYSAYTGPAIKLLRATDNTTQDFYFTVTGNLPRQAIQDWASSNTPSIVTLYDQSPQGNHIQFISGYNAKLTLNNTQGFPEVTWAANCRAAVNVPTNGLTGFSAILRASDGGGNGYFMRQDWFVGPFLVGPGTLNVYNGTVGASVNFSQGSTWSDYGFSWVSNTTSGIKGYLNGTLNQSADTPAMTMSPAYSQGSTEMGYFKFYQPAYWAGAFQEFTLLAGTLSATQMVDFHNRTATYYGTALAPLGGLAPAIAGYATSQTVYNFTYAVPFAGVTITDQNTSPTDSATITISGDSTAVLTGTGITGSNPYTIAATTAAALTTTLNALHYRSTNAVGTTATLTLKITSSTGTNATTTATLTTIASQAETPFAAPTGTWTPIAGNATYKGVNIGGGENSFPTNNGYNYAYPFDEEIDYFASKGMGLIRVLTASGRFFPVAYGLADPPGTRASGDVPNLYRQFPSGSRTNVLSLKAVLDHAFTKGVRVLIDPHGYASVFDGRVNTNINAGPGEGANLLADQLGRLATLYKNYPNVVWSLNNEPVGCSAADWYTTACQCVAAIRAAGATQKIFISVGGSYDSALGIQGTQGTVWDNFNQPGWTGNNGDPLDNFAIEVHAYLDSNNSGIIDNVRYTGFGNDVLVGATAWAKTKSDGTARAKPFKMFLGEFGTSTSAAPMAELNNELTYMSNNSDVWLGWTFFLGGSFLFFQGYTFGYVGPAGMGSGGPYTDKPQMAYLVSHLP